MKALRCEIEAQPQDLIGQKRLRRCSGVPGRGMIDQSPRDLRSPVVQRRFQNTDRGLTKRRSFTRQGCQRFGKRTTINQRAAVGDLIEAFGHLFPLVVCEGYVTRCDTTDLGRRQSCR
jgi:hypothetical protein